ncbi:MAG: hypothetical protein HOI95_28155 [Chromatiales bacterium]|nr:hypothetical protein [Chromatiales bacterium]
MNPALVLAGEPIQVPLYRLREGRAVRLALAHFHGALGVAFKLRGPLQPCA